MYKVKEKTIMFDDFVLEIQCDEYYSEGGEYEYQ